MANNSWKSREKPIDEFFVKFKSKGLFSKEYNMKLEVYKKHIEGVGVELIYDEIIYKPYSFYILLIPIQKLSITTIDGTEFLKIDYSKN